MLKLINMCGTRETYHTSSLVEIEAAISSIVIFPLLFTPVTQHICILIVATPAEEGWMFLLHAF